MNMFEVAYEVRASIIILIITRVNLTHVML